MNRFFTLLLAASCLTAVGQVEIEYPYNPDFENDGSVGIEDLMSLLSVYGLEFTPEELIVNGSSLSDVISTLQAQIDSLAAYTDTGISSLSLSDSTIVEYLVAAVIQSEQADSTLASWVFELSDALEAYENESLNFRCGDSVEFEGHSYSSVKVAGKCWFAENVRYIPEIFHPSDTSSSSSRYCVEGYTGNSLDEAMASEGFLEFGVYYNEFAFRHDTLCPAGWRLPSIYDWKELYHATSNPYLPVSTPEFHGCRDLLHGDYDWDFSNCPSDCGLFTNGTGLSIRAHQSIYMWSPYWSTGSAHAYFAATDPSARVQILGNQVYFYPAWQVGRYYPARCIKD